MLKQSFKDKIEFDIYLAEQKILKIKGYLSVSERKQLESMLDKNYKPTIEQTPKPRIPLVTYITELRKPCIEVQPGENIKEIIKGLKDTLSGYDGYGLTANQIGINKRISYLKIPRFDSKTKKMELAELVIINAKIIEKDNPIKVKNEMCLSFPGVPVITKRYVFCTVTYLNENFKEQTFLAQDLEALILQHEIDHQNGITIFDRKWKAR
jgi:peptide deformylase